MINLLQALPYFGVLVFIESVVRWLQRLPRLRINDSITSLSIALMWLMLNRMLLRGLEVSAYSWVHLHLRLVDLPWDSSLTWWVCFFGFDLAFYWFHRMAHGGFCIRANHIRPAVCLAIVRPPV